MEQVDESKTEGHWWLSDGQRHAVDRQRHFAVRETMRLIAAGRRTEAASLLQRGFEKQVRLAGLEKAVIESREKENA